MPNEDVNPFIVTEADRQQYAQEKQNPFIVTEADKTAYRETQKQENPFVVTEADRIAYTEQSTTVPIQDNVAKLAQAKGEVEKTQRNATWSEFLNSGMGQYYTQLATKLHDSVVEPVVKFLTPDEKTINDPFIQVPLQAAKQGVAAVGSALGKSGQAIEQMGDINLLTTPAELAAFYGSKLNGDVILKKLGLPETFDIPDLVRFGNPFVAKLADMVGGDPRKFADRLALGIFIDQAGLMGMNHVLEAIPAKGAIETVSKLDSLPSEAKAILSDEIARAGLMNAPRASKSLTEESLKQAISDHISTYTNIISSNNERIVGGIKYKIIPNGAQQIKRATIYDQIDVAYTDMAKIIDNEKVINEATSPQELLPKPGQIEQDADFLARGQLCVAASPRRFAPKVYGFISEEQQMENNIKVDLYKELAQYEPLMGKQERLIIGGMADGRLPKEAILEHLKNGTLTENGLQALSVWRKVAKQAADIEGIPEERRLVNYLNHEFEKTKNLNLPNSEEIVYYRNNYNRYLQQRKGVDDGYSLDLFDVAKIRISGAAKFAARNKYDPIIQEEIKNIKEIDPFRGKWTDLYYNNYRGQLSKGLTGFVQRHFTGPLKSMFAQGSIGFGLPSGMMNITQGPLLGATEIGYIPYIKGSIKTLKAMMGGDPVSRELVSKSGLLTDLSTKEIGSYTNLWEKFIPKPLMDAANFFMNVSETLNKSAVYLGAREDALKQLSLFKKLMDENVEIPKGLSKWFELRKINPTGEAEHEAWKYAHLATVKTQFDMGKSGQTFMQIVPILDMGSVFTNYPLKTAEYITETFVNTLGYLGKAILKPSLLPTVLNHPSVAASMRLGLNVLAVNMIGAGLGISVKRLVGLENMIPNSIPWADTVIKLTRSIEGYSQNNPGDGEKVLRYGLQLSGFPMTSPTWLIRNAVQFYIDNKDNPSDKWKLYRPGVARIPKNVLATVNPFVHYMDMFTHYAKDPNEEAYYDNAKERAKISNRQIAASKVLDLAIDAHDSEKIKQANLNLKKIKEDARTLKQAQQKLKSGSWWSK